MAFFSLARSRAVVMQPLRRNARFMSYTYTGPTVEFEHFASGWKNVEDIEEFTEDGKYQLQTFNKISPQVGLSFS
jgi:hypothetical protein